MIDKWSDKLLPIVVCPKCRSRIARCRHLRLVPARIDADTFYRCTNPHCRLAEDGFPLLSGQPVLIDFDDSIIDRDEIVCRGGGSVLPRDYENAKLTNKVQRLVFGENKIAKRIAADLVKMLRARHSPARVLIIGGASIGNGASLLYSDPDIEIIALDVYASPYTTFVADAHRLPLAESSVDAVWIQAVLQHVLDPGIVVDEIHRVLKPDGLVFSDTPFMQQVHEGLYDFTRFTVHGQRWLFRKFKMIDAGATRGAGTGLNWSIRYFVRALTRSGPVGTLASLLFFWIAYIDRLLDDGLSADAASGVYFFGLRTDTSIAPRDMVGFYDELRHLRAGRAAVNRAAAPCVHSASGERKRNY